MERVDRNAEANYMLGCRCGCVRVAEGSSQEKGLSYRLEGSVLKLYLWVKRVSRRRLSREEGEGLCQVRRSRFLEEIHNP